MKNITLKTTKGFSLVEVLMAMGIFAIVAVMMGVIIGAHGDEQMRNRLKTSITDSRHDILSIVQNEVAWKKTMSMNASTFACVEASTEELATKGCTELEEAIPFAVYNSASSTEPMFYDVSQPGNEKRGFTSLGVPCDSYPMGDCRLQIGVAWKPKCVEYPCSGAKVQDSLDVAFALAGINEMDARQVGKKAAGKGGSGGGKGGSAPVAQTAPKWMKNINPEKFTIMNQLRMSIVTAFNGSFDYGSSTPTTTLPGSPSTTTTTVPGGASGCRSKYCTPVEICAKIGHIYVGSKFLISSLSGCGKGSCFTAKQCSIDKDGCIDPVVIGGCETTTTSTTITTTTSTTTLPPTTTTVRAVTTTTLPGGNYCVGGNCCSREEFTNIVSTAQSTHVVPNGDISEQCYDPAVRTWANVAGVPDRYVDIVIGAMSSVSGTGREYKWRFKNWCAKTFCMLHTGPADAHANGYITTTMISDLVPSDVRVGGTTTGALRMTNIQHIGDNNNAQVTCVKNVRTDLIPTACQSLLDARPIVQSFNLSFEDFRNATGIVLSHATVEWTDEYFRNLGRVYCTTRVGEGYVNGVSPGLHWASQTVFIGCFRDMSAYNSLFH